MRTITLSGTMRQYVLFQLINSDLPLETSVKQHLLNQGWNVQSVSIQSQSYLNNTLNVRVVINALGNDSSQRIDDGISSDLANFRLNGDQIFRDVSLRVTADSGFEAPTIGAAATGTPRVTVVRVIKKPVNVGTIATVDVRADEEGWGQSTEFDSSNPNADQSSSTISPVTIIAGVFLLALLLRR